MARVTFEVALRDVATKEANVSGAVINAIALGIGYHEQLGEDHFALTLKGTKDRHGNTVPEGTRKVIGAAVRKLVAYRGGERNFADAPDRKTAREKTESGEEIPRLSEKVEAAIAAKPNDSGDVASMVAYLRSIMDAADYKAIATLPGRLDEIAGKVTAKGATQKKRAFNGRNDTDKPDVNSEPVEHDAASIGALPKEDVSDADRAESITRMFGDILDTGIMATLIRDLNAVLDQRLAQAQAQTGT
jgi:hypothetical protein